MKRKTKSREDGGHASNTSATPYRSSSDVPTSLNPIMDNCISDYKYVSLKQHVMELYVNEPELLKAWKSSENIIQNALAQVVFEIVTGKILEEELP
jgi:hypothetical protein